VNFLLHLGFSQRNDVSIPEKNSVDGIQFVEEEQTAGAMLSVSLAIFGILHSVHGRWREV
jgi:hypothetical protein